MSASNPILSYRNLIRKLRKTSSWDSYKKLYRMIRDSGDKEAFSALYNLILWRAFTDKIQTLLLHQNKTLLSQDR